MNQTISETESILSINSRLSRPVSRLVISLIALVVQRQRNNVGQIVSGHFHHGPIKFVAFFISPTFEIPSLLLEFFGVPNSEAIVRLNLSELLFKAPPLIGPGQEAAHNCEG